MSFLTSMNLFHKAGIMILLPQAFSFTGQKLTELLPRARPVPAVGGAAVTIPSICFPGVYFVVKEA